jgi:hypothetical protein
MSRVLVCGGRDFSDKALAFRVLDGLHARQPITALIEGGARGADTIGREWAIQYRSIVVRTFPADWATHGRAAGPIRNQQMLDEGRPDLVVAFPGGKGTADMVRRAKEAGVPIETLLNPLPHPHN